MFFDTISLGIGPLAHFTRLSFSQHDSFHTFYKLFHFRCVSRDIKVEQNKEFPPELKNFSHVSAKFHSNINKNITFIAS